MIDVPKELNQDIDGVKNPDRKIGYRVFGIVLFLSISLNIYIIREYNKKGTKFDDSQEDRIKSIRTQYLKKDSAYIDCLNSKNYDAHQAIMREQRYNEEYKLQVKRQDSLIALLNKYR